MFVGFAGATGQLVDSHHILGWSFSNDNASIGDALNNVNLPSFVRSVEESFVRSKGFVAGIVVGGLSFVIGVIVFVILLRRSKGIKEVDEEEGMEDWEMEYWPHRIDYRVIHEATGGFEEENVIGYGGNGKVYRGRLDGGMEVTVKRISLQNRHGMREFLAEVSSLGRLKHRNLVSIKGWCKKEKGSLISVHHHHHLSWT
ncbi:L-type lectin-domain containing receptor kinase VII.1 [Linum perenne]